MRIRGTVRRRVAPRIRACFSRLGLDLRSWPPPYHIGRQLRDFLGEFRINCVLDVGAFHGRYCDLLRTIGYPGHIVSFEPVFESFQILTARMSGDRCWTGYNLGLSDSDRQTTINTYEAGDFNSLLPLRSFAGDTYHFDAGNMGRQQITLRRLDSLFAEVTRGIPEPRVFLKMDTQGHDVAVVQGASGCLEHILGLQSEIPAIELYEGMPTMPEAIAAYRERGYVPIGFYPVNTVREKFVSPEFDVLFNRLPDGMQADSPVRATEESIGRGGPRRPSAGFQTAPLPGATSRSTG